MGSKSQQTKQHQPPGVNMYTFYLALPFRPIFYIESDCDKLIAKLVLQYGIYAKEHIDISADISFSILRKEQGYIFYYHNVKKSNKQADNIARVLYENIT